MVERPSTEYDGNALCSSAQVLWATNYYLNTHQKEME